MHVQVHDIVAHKEVMQDQHGDFIDPIAAQDITQSDAIAHAHTMQFHDRFLNALQHTPDTGFDIGLGAAFQLASDREIHRLFIDIVRSLPQLTILLAAAVIVPLPVPEWLEGIKLMRVAVAFAVFFAAYQAEIIRAGLQSTPDGQEEAVSALGMPYWSLVVDILLPQAFRNTLLAKPSLFVGLRDRVNRR